LLSLALLLKLDVSTLDFTGALDEGDGDNWGYKTCKLSSSQITINKPTNFFRPDALPVAQQCQSTEEKISHSMDLLSPSSPGIIQLCL